MIHGKLSNLLYSLFNLFYDINFTMIIRRDVVSSSSIQKFISNGMWVFSSVLVIISTSMLLVTVDFTTHGGSHLYGIRCPSTDSLDPMDHFCTFDVSKIIPKNMQ